ncbi:MAG: rod shape-determining protein MreD [Deltaproteobacteria bacterium]|jgi:rod shape-determining protein MreD|nr:rod shape-determining protein MreD [Deltaproteobacteria bacterium]MBW2382637.1 rod shape-determining protein MreD [Deltaproteobacteria bacterium]MBW2694874.1 rod shape-determining protein MreD [Deltaproteobacteria bacterium]
MKSGIALLVTGILALVLQGALATFVSPPWCPDLGVLVVICIGLRWRGLAAGLCLAALLGFAADLLSGSLMGQHALLRVVAFASAFFAGRQLNLKGSLPLVIFSAAVTVGYGIALVAVSTFFVGRTPLTLGGVADLLLHGGINGLVAPFVYSVITRVSIWAGEDDANSRTLHFDPQGRIA